MRPSSQPLGFPASRYGMLYLLKIHVYRRRYGDGGFLYYNSVWIESCSIPEPLSSKNCCTLRWSFEPMVVFRGKIARRAAVALFHRRCRSICARVDNRPVRVERNHGVLPHVILRVIFRQIQLLHAPVHVEFLIHHKITVRPERDTKAPRSFRG